MKRHRTSSLFVFSCLSLFILGLSTQTQSALAFASNGKHSPLFRNRRYLRNISPRSFSLDSKMAATETENKLRFHEIVERDAKKVPVVSTSAIAAKLFLLVPLWLTLVLPLTIIYQASKAVLGLFRATDEPEFAGTPMVVNSSDIIPRSDREHDVVVLGATGFTGGLAVRHLAKTYGTGNGGSIKWAIAGRSEAKLKSVLKQLAVDLGMPKLAEDGAVDLIICDTSDVSTLPSLVRNTRSVATTAGPFSLYGERVVEACAKYGTHYTDITGETSFVKLMKSRYQGEAIKSGARIVSLCGNDCIPWDLSYNLLADEFASSKTDETLESVEFQNEFSSNASGGTLKTMCMGLSGKLAPIYPQDENQLRRPFAQGTTEHDAPMENAINNGIKTGIQKPWKMATTQNGASDEEDTLVEGPFVMSAVNCEAVGWSHALRRDPKCSYKEQLLLPDFKTALDGSLTLLVFFTSLMNPLTLGIVEKLMTQPGDGPDMTSMEQDYFLAVTGTARGSKGTIIQSLLYYNKDPGYLETARMLVESALCLALEEEAVDQNIADVYGESTYKYGGFFSPGFALRKNLLRRLVDTGCHYEVRVVQDQR